MNNEVIKEIIEEHREMFEKELLVQLIQTVKESINMRTPDTVHQVVSEFIDERLRPELEKEVLNMEEELVKDAQKFTRQMVNSTIKSLQAKANYVYSDPDHAYRIIRAIFK